MIPRKIPTVRLIVLIVLLLSIFSGFLIFNNQEFTANKNNRDEMYYRAKPIIQLTNLRFSLISDIRSNVKHLIFSEDSFISTFRQIKKSKKLINTNWGGYNLVKYGEDIEFLKAKTQNSLMGTFKKLDILLAISNEDDFQIKRQFLIDEVNSSIEKSIHYLNKLILQHNDSVESLRKINVQQSSESRKRFEIVLALYLLITLFIGYFIIKDLNKLLLSLKASHNKLRESQRNYRSVFDNAADGLFIIGEDKLIKAVNKKGLEITGYSHGELINRKPENLHLKEDSVLNPFIWTDLEFGQSVLRQRKLVRKDNKVLDVEMNTTLIGKNEILSVVRDVSDRIKSEKAHKISQEKFAIAVQHSSDIICITSYPEGVFMEINDAFTKLTGYSSDEIIGLPTSDFNFYKNPAIRPKVLEEIKEKGEILNIEIEFKKKNNEFISTLMTSNLFYIEDTPYVFSTIKDISKEKLVQQELLHAETRIKELVDSTEAVIWEADAKTFEMTYVNPFVEKLFGYPVDEWYKKDFWGTHIHPDDRDKAISYC